MGYTNRSLKSLFTLMYPFVASELEHQSVASLASLVNCVYDEAAYAPGKANELTPELNALLGSTAKQRQLHYR